jgi:NAD(P)-dependent dehydrogenase (short-subunit alcohol dehydrogenase family)
VRYFVGRSPEEGPEAKRMGGARRSRAWAMLRCGRSVVSAPRGLAPLLEPSEITQQSLHLSKLIALIYRPDRIAVPQQRPPPRRRGSLGDLDWVKRPWDAARAYAESKLHVVALAFALARRWPQVLSNVVDPSWAVREWAAQELRSTFTPGRGPRPGWPSATSLPPWSADATGIISGRSSRPARPLIQSFRTSSSRN